jgi:hypothetical protein
MFSIPAGFQMRAQDPPQTAADALPIAMLLPPVPRAKGLRVPPDTSEAFAATDRKRISTRIVMRVTCLIG